MSYYVVRSDNDLAHHGVLGMKWGVWNDETRARRTGSRARKKKYDYSDLSDADLQKKLNRKRNEDQLRQLEKKEEPKSKYQIAEGTLKKVAAILALTAGISASVLTIKKNVPEAMQVVTTIANKYKDMKMSAIGLPIDNWDEILKHI